MTDYIKRAEALAPEERTLDFPAKQRSAQWRRTCPNGGFR